MASVAGLLRRSGASIEHLVPVSHKRPALPRRALKENRRPKFYPGGFAKNKFCEFAVRKFAKFRYFLRTTIKKFWPLDFRARVWQGRADRTTNSPSHIKKGAPGGLAPRITSN